jgi:hypothetical protein
MRVELTLTALVAPPTSQILYLEVFYRDVAAFLLSFVAVHLEVCFSEREREQAFDVFFDGAVVPPSRVIGALAATLSATKTKEDGTDKTADEDAEASISQCIRLLENAVTAGGAEHVVTEMLTHEQQVGAALRVTKSCYCMCAHPIAVF